MSLRTNGSTLWVFLLGAHSGQVEQRFVFDVAFGILALETAGVDSDNIRVLIDNSGKITVDDVFSRTGLDRYTIIETSDLSDVLREDSRYSDIVMFVTGHGNHEYIVAEKPIKPVKLINDIKSVGNIRRAVLYLGQCYAGIFNYLSVGRTRDEINTDDGCEIIVIGASNLSPSISISTTEDFGVEKIPWHANIFLLGLFVWIRNPIDIDGDGKCTIMDSYKFAGSYANQFLAKRDEIVFANSLADLIRFKVSIEEIDKQIHAQGINNIILPGGRKLTAIELMAARAAITQKMQIANNEVVMCMNHQESWILNARPAQEIEF